MRDIEQLWEERSRQYGIKSEGVLPKSLPASVNESIHQWMYGEIYSNVKLLAHRHKNLNILDVGCGYGRLSKPLLAEFPNVRTFGVDVSRQYVKLYNQTLSPRGMARKGDIRKLPFAKNTLDMVFVVTTLMYVIKKSDQEEAIKECLRVLRPRGRFVIIERNPTGHSIVTLCGLITKIRGKKHSEISSVSFSPSEMTTLIKKGDGKILRIRGIPIWTVFLPLSVFLSYLNHGFVRWFLRIMSVFDKKFGRLLTPSLYISYTCTKK